MTNATTKESVIEIAKADAKEHLEEGWVMFDGTAADLAAIRKHLETVDEYPEGYLDAYCDALCELAASDMASDDWDERNFKEEESFIEGGFAPKFIEYYFVYAESIYHNSDC